MKRNKVYLQWRTAEEKKFIKHLHKYYFDKFEKYANSINLRREWGDIHKHKIENLIKELLKKCSG